MEFVSGLYICVVTDDDEILNIEELLEPQPDISEYLDLYFCETVKYYEPGSFPE